MKTFLLAAVLVSSAGLGACNTIRVTNDYDTSVDFAALETWSWYPEAGAPGSDPEGIVSLTSSRIRADLESELVARGYSKSTDGDFEVAFHAVLSRRVDAGTAPYGYAWRRGYMGMAAAPDIMFYDEGTLLVDFIDPKTKTMIWRGTATSVVDPGSSAEKHAGAIHEAVTKILAQFPPRKH
jgi:hypothetical protein